MFRTPDHESVDVLAAVQTHWDVGAVVSSPLPGGMNSTTWVLTTDDGGPGRRWVAKLVAPRNRDSFLRGLELATRLDRAGIAAGVPEPTRSGELFLDVADGVLAVLRWVEGRPLTGADRREQTLIGRTLGRVHRALDAEEGGPRPRWREFPPWLDVEAGHLDVEEWVRPAVRTALARYAELGGQLEEASGRGPTCGRLHADPEPGAFRWSPERQDCGLIDWSSTEPGPLLYDLASAALYVGGPVRAGALVEAYAATGVLPAGEIAAGLEVLLELRWAVQADYFARRVATEDLTGIADAAENLRGLHDARNFFHP